MPHPSPLPSENFVRWFRSAAPYIHAFRGRVFVIAFGGEVVADGKFVELTHDLAKGHDECSHARVQALAAHCYGLSEDEFSHVLTTFPLIDTSARDRAFEEFRRSNILG